MKNRDNTSINISKGVLEPNFTEQHISNLRKINIIVRFASHAKINTFSVFILKNETGDPSVSQVLKLLESGFDSPEGSL